MADSESSKPADEADKAYKPFAGFQTDIYEPTDNRLQAFLFHPATLAALGALGLEVLDELVPKGGYEPYIPNMQLYNERMAKSMADKVGYLERIENAQIIIDFGCADGKLLKYLQATDPSKHYIGYDISLPMLDLAKEKNPGNITFTDSWDEVLAEAKAEAEKRGEGTTLVLSSIMHEIYHYLPPREVDAFWDKVFKSDFDTIAIRDMMTNHSINRASKPEDIAKIRAHYDADKIAEWERHWGPLSENKSMVHFLLTCPYKENWARELQENYLPMSIQELISHIPDTYEIAYLEHYTLPYFKDSTQQTFDIEVEDNTHMKLILQKARRTLDKVQRDKSELIGAFDEADPATHVCAILKDGALHISTDAHQQAL